MSLQIVDLRRLFTSRSIIAHINNATRVDSAEGVIHTYIVCIGSSKYNYADHNRILIFRKDRGSGAGEFIHVLHFVTYVGMSRHPKQKSLVLI